MPRADLLALIAAAKLKCTPIDKAVLAQKERLVSPDQATVLELIRLAAGG
jgi:hypothetical protein